MLPAVGHRFEVGLLVFPPNPAVVRSQLLLAAVVEVTQDAVGRVDDVPAGLNRPADGSGAGHGRADDAAVGVDPLGHAAGDLRADAAGRLADGLGAGRAVVFVRAGLLCERTDKLKSIS